MYSLGVSEILVELGGGGSCSGGGRGEWWCPKGLLGGYALARSARHDAANLSAAVAAAAAAAAAAADGEVEEVAEVTKGSEEEDVEVEAISPALPRPKK